MVRLIARDGRDALHEIEDAFRRAALLRQHSVYHPGCLCFREAPATQHRIEPISRRCGRPVSDAHGTQSACDDGAVDPIAVSDHVAWSLVPGECLRDLSRDPICGRICCDVDPDKISATEPDDDESIEQVETDGRNNEQVHGGNVRRVVMQEGPPSLAGRPSPFDHDLATLDCPNLKPKLEQLSMNARRAPKRILHAHPADQSAQLRVDLWTPSPVGATSNASSSESRLCATARGSQAG